MTIRYQPLLTRGGLSGRIYVVTKWRDLGNGAIEAVEKFDVTDQYDDLYESDDRTPEKLL